MAVDLINNGHVLFPHYPNWREQPRFKRTWQTEIGNALTEAEDRGAVRVQPLISLTARIPSGAVNAVEMQLLEDRLRAAKKSGLAAMPFWGRSFVLTGDASGTLLGFDSTSPWTIELGDYLFFYDAAAFDHTAWNVRIVSELPEPGIIRVSVPLSRTFKAGTYFWPVVFGKPGFDQVTISNDEKGSLSLTVQELAPSTPVPGAPAYSFTYYLTRPVFPFPINWSSPVTKQFSFDLRELQLGFGAPVYSSTQSHVAQGYEFSLDLLNDLEIARFDDFTAALKGRLKGFWLPSPLDGMQVESAGDQTSFNILDQNLTQTFADHPSKLIYATKPGLNPEILQIDSVLDNGNGTEMVFLSVASVNVIDPTWTVQRLHYVRLTSDEEEARFKSEGQQHRTLRVIELPTEYAALETGEEPIYLYHFWANTDPVQHWYYTSFASNITSNGQVHTAKPISHGAIKTTLRLESENLQLDGVYEAGHPLALLTPFALPVPLWIDVKEVTYGALNAATLLFTGRVTKGTVRGKKITARCASVVETLDRPFPRMPVGPMCPYQLFQPDTCKFNPTPSAFRGTGTINAVLSSGSVIRIDYAGFAGLSAGFLALGYVEIGAGATYERIGILNSAAAVGNLVDVTLNRPSLYAAAAQTIKFYAGCDRLPATCSGKFVNYDNYGGTPLITSTLNLRVIPVRSVTGGKK